MKFIVMSFLMALCVTAKTNAITIRFFDPVVMPLLHEQSWGASVLEAMNNASTGAGLVNVIRAVPVRPEYLFAPNTPGASGKRIFFRVRFTSNNPGETFSLSELVSTVEESTVQNYLGQTFRYANASYSNQAIGVWWGPDGVAGTTDDVVRTSGSAADPVNDLLFIGVGVAYTTNTSADQQAVIDHLRNNPGFTITAMYRIERSGVTLATGMTKASTVGVGTHSVRISRTGNNVTITPVGADGLYNIQMSTGLTGTWSSLGNKATPQAGVTVPMSGRTAFYRPVLQ